MSSDAVGMFTVMQNAPGSPLHIDCHQSWEDLMRLWGFKSSVRTAASQRCGWQIELCSQLGSSLGLGCDYTHTHHLYMPSRCYMYMFIAACFNRSLVLNNHILYDFVLKITHFQTAEALREVSIFPFCVLGLWYFVWTHGQNSLANLWCNKTIIFCLFCF